MAKAEQERQREAGSQAAPRPDPYSFSQSIQHMMSNVRSSDR